MRYSYPRSRNVAAVATDVLLVCLAIALPITRPAGSLSIALSIAIPCVLSWGIVTLHYPRAIETDAEGITFSGYGFLHRYSWDAVTIHIRKFLVRDRVLLRLSPAPPWRGRYWILSALDGYDELVTELSHRQPKPAERRGDGRVLPDDRVERVE